MKPLDFLMENIFPLTVYISCLKKSKHSLPEKKEKREKNPLVVAKALALLLKL